MRTSIFLALVLASSGCKTTSRPASSVQANIPVAPDLVTEGVVCKKQAASDFYTLVGPDEYPYAAVTAQLRKSECLEAATGARNGLICLPYPALEDGYIPAVLVDLKTHEPWISASARMTKRGCQQIVSASGPGGICLYMNAPSSVVWRYRDEIVRTWPTPGQYSRESGKAAIQCTELIAKPREESLRFDATVAREPAFEPGTTNIQLVLLKDDQSQITVSLSPSAAIDLTNGHKPGNLVGARISVVASRSPDGRLTAMNVSTHGDL